MTKEQILKEFALILDRCEDGCDIDIINSAIYELERLKNCLVGKSLDFEIETNKDGEVVHTSPFAYDTLSNIEIKGKNFVFTGCEPSFSRTLFCKLIKNLGGVYHDNLKMSTDYLIVGELASAGWSTAGKGNKIKKAEQWRSQNNKPKIITATHFIKLVESAYDS